MGKSRLTLLFLSFLFTLAMWIAMSQTSTPYTERIFTGIKIQIRGLNNNKVVLNDVPDVNIKVRGPEDIISTMPQPVAWVRIPEDAIGDIVLNVNVDLPSNVTLLDLNPSSVALRIDKVTSKQLNIFVLNNEHIDVTEQFKILPPQITITGPHSIINSIEKALIILPSSSISDKYRFFVSDILLIGSDGKPKSHNLITIEPPEIKLSKFIVKYDYIQLPVIPKIKGYIEGEYILDGINIDPPFVVVRTPTDNIPIKTVYTKEITLDGMYPSTVTVNIDEKDINNWGSIIYPSSKKVKLLFKWKKTKVTKIQTTVGGKPWIVILRCPEDVTPPPDIVDDRGKIIDHKIPDTCVIIYSGIY